MKNQHEIQGKNCEIEETKSEMMHYYENLLKAEHLQKEIHVGKRSFQPDPQIILFIITMGLILEIVLVVLFWGKI